MSDYRTVIFTGTRRSTRRLRTAVNRELFAEYEIATAAGKRLFVAVGDCPTGVDGNVRAWCSKHLLITEWRVYKADWKRFGNSAGPRRNRGMCEAHKDADEVVAFPASLDRELSRGTWDCLDAATELGIPTRIILPEVWS